jgi:hypothetical protein
MHRHMDRARLTRLVRESYEHWFGTGAWERASKWRKADWKTFIVSIIREVEHPERPILPSEMPTPPQPFRPARPLRADATDSNPEEDDD